MIFVVCCYYFFWYGEWKEICCGVVKIKLGGFGCKYEIFFFYIYFTKCVCWKNMHKHFNLNLLPPPETTTITAANMTASQPAQLKGHTIAP